MCSFVLEPMKYKLLVLLSLVLAASVHTMRNPLARFALATFTRGMETFEGRELFFFAAFWGGILGFGKAGGFKESKSKGSASHG